MLSKSVVTKFGPMWPNTESSRLWRPPSRAAQRHPKSLKQGGVSMLRPNRQAERNLFWLTIIFGVFSLLMISAAMVSCAQAHDPASPELDEWYATRKQPDTGISCCGPSDAYFCDEGARGQQVICTINDDRDDRPLHRIHVPNGTVIEIPPHKFNKDPNPTGRAVVWLSSSQFVWCFVGISGS